MNKTVFFISIIIFFEATSFTKDKKIDSPNDLGKEIFEAIKSKDLKRLLKLVVTGKEIAATIEKSGDNSSDLKSFKDQLVAKIDGDMAKTKKGIEEGYGDITNDINKNNCNKLIQLGQITPKTDKLKNYPVELGEIEVEYKCNEQTESFTVKIIKTSAGWRIMEKLRMVYKQQ